MLAFPAGFKIYLAVAPVDMRKQFNGLWAEAEHQLKIDPRQGAVFVFGNRQRDRIKLLYWDGTGVWVLAKRLEQGAIYLAGGVVHGGSGQAVAGPRALNDAFSGY